MNIVPLVFPGEDDPLPDEWRLVRVKAGTPGGHGSWVETNHPAVVACMGSVPECANNGCQARIIRRKLDDLSEWVRHNAILPSDHEGSGRVVPLSLLRGWLQRQSVVGDLTVSAEVVSPQKDGALRKAVEQVIAAYGDAGWAKSEMCRRLRLALQTDGSAEVVSPPADPLNVVCRQCGKTASKHWGAWGPDHNFDPPAEVVSQPPQEDRSLVCRDCGCHKNDRWAHGPERTHDFVSAEGSISSPTESEK